MKGKGKTKADKNLSQKEERLQEIRKNLLHQKELLLSEAGIALNTLPDETLFPELGDQASADIDRNFMLRLKGRERQLLKKIDDALEKIENGNYGICEICGEEINIKRLEARPVTTMCIECKTEQEEEEKLREK
ncbi:MAG: TraR/DksA C4-type zinc finger protein [Nitrospirae bacterium]|nr:TraR/DksA C4-type zinc finger protein [Nitrospirota bacterium]